MSEVKTTTINELDIEWEKAWCKKRGLPENYNRGMYHVPTNKNIQYISKLILNGLDNDTINTRLVKYRKIRITEESLNKRRNWLTEYQKKNTNRYIWEYLEKELDNNTIREKFTNEHKLIEMNIPDKHLDEVRKKVESVIESNKGYEDVSCEIVELGHDLDLITILHQELKESHPNVCPFCHNLINFELLEDVKTSKKERMNQLKTIRRNMAERKL